MKRTEALKLRSVIEQAVASLDDARASEAPTLFPGMRYDGNLIGAGTRCQTFNLVPAERGT